MSHFSQPPDQDSKIQARVNNVIIDMDGSVADGGDILRKAGFLPADEHILVQIRRPGTIAKGLDEEVNLEKVEDREFRAFAFDRTLNFTVDGVGYVWGSGSISVVELHDITCTGHDKVFFLERQDEPDQVLALGEMLDVGHRGIEHLHSGNCLVSVRYGETCFELERRFYTTEELLALFKVPNGYVLDLIHGDGDFRELKPNERIKAREGLEFISHAPCGQSS